MCFCSVVSLVQLFAIPRTAACQTSLSFIISLSLLRLMSIKARMPSNHLILCHLLLLLPSMLPRIRVFFNESALCIRWPKNWNVSVSPSNEYSRLISFRIDQFDLLWSRDSQESSPTPQFESINSSALSLLYGPTLTSYITTGKTIALTRWTFDYMDYTVSKVMSLLFNTLCCCCC